MVCPFLLLKPRTSILRTTPRSLCRWVPHGWVPTPPSTIRCHAGPDPTACTGAPEARVPMSSVHGMLHKCTSCRLPPPPGCVRIPLGAQRHPSHRHCTWFSHPTPLDGSIRKSRSSYSVVHLHSILVHLKYFMFPLDKALGCFGPLLLSTGLGPAVQKHQRDRSRSGCHEGPHRAPSAQGIVPGPSTRGPTQPAPIQFTRTSDEQWLSREIARNTCETLIELEFFSLCVTFPAG